MTLDLFAGICVRDLSSVRAWYCAVLGSDVAFAPNDAELVWELAGHRFVYVERKPDRAGHAMVMIFVGDLGAVVTRISSQGIEPASRETYENGVEKVTYRDADGNEVSYGGGPDDAG